MRGKTLFITLLGVFALNSCSLLTRVAEKKYAKNFELEDTYSAEFYTSEGIKAASIYGDAKSSSELFELAIKTDSSYSPAYYYRAETLGESDTQKALELSLKANALDTLNNWYKEQLGRMLIVNEKYPEALTHYKMLVERVPSEVNNYRLLAAIYQQERQPLNAIEVLESAQDKFGRIEELSDFKRQLLIQVNQIDKAIAESLTIEEEYPFNVENLVILGELYAANKRNALALKYFKKALEISPTNAGALIAINRFYQLSGDSENYYATLNLMFLNADISLDHKVYLLEQLTSSKDVYTKSYHLVTNLINSLLIVYPDDFTVIELYAKHLLLAKKIDEALDFYKSKLGDDKTQFSIANSIISIESYLNRADSVAKYSAIAIENSPKNPEVYMNLASSLSYLKKTSEALKLYEKALEYAPVDSLKSVIYGMMGDAIYFHSNKTLAENYYKKSLKLDKDNALILNNYAYFLLTEKNKKSGYTKALKMAVQATDMVKNSPTFLDTYAWALYKTGDFPEAKKVMQKALSLDNNRSSELLIHYGDILYALEDYLMAEIYWQKALSRGADKQEIEQRLNKLKNK